MTRTTTSTTQYTHDQGSIMTATDTERTSVLDPSVWDGKIYTDAWTEGSAGTIEVLEPATGAVLGRAGMASAEDARQAATRAAAAQQAWAATKPEERAAILRRAGDFFETHAAELGQWVQRETGAIGAKAALETHVAANECFDAAALPHHPAGDVLTSNAEHWSFARRVPAGVVAVISPFNFPLILSIRSV
ncbi:MAG: aldehyde dehydrogenase family protein, partial [Citricoccus sp.]|nr:aldehyde dehydrogenase family protein [Citricoccus sp. WCRC_4]